MADEKVVPFPGITTLDADPANILRFAMTENFQRVLVIGLLDDGSLYTASSTADGGTLLWDMERTKHRLMLTADEMEE